MKKALFLTLFISISALAAEPDFSHVIYESYAQVMNLKFAEMANLSKTSKTRADFLRSLFQISKDSEENKMLVGKFAEMPVPSMTTVKNGIEFFENGKRFQITLSPKLGVLLIDGHDMAENLSGKMSATQAWFGILERPARAGIVADGIKAIIQGDAKDFAIVTTKATAVTASGGAVVGCVAGAAYPKELVANGDMLDRCAYGATVVGATLLATGAAALGLGELAFASGKLWDARLFAKVSFASESVKKMKLGPILAKLGAAWLLFKNVEPYAFAKGAKLVCVGNEGAFRYVALADENQGYSVGAMDDSATHAKLSLDLKDDEIVQNLRGYDLLKTPEEKSAIVRQVKSEMQDRSKICKAHGNGYSEKYLFEKSAGTSIEKIKESAQ